MAADRRTTRPREPFHSRGATELLRQAAIVRDDWLSAGLSALPADRTTAEAAITELYHLVRESAPSFEWVPSPWAAGTGRPGLEPVRLRAATAPGAGRDWPVAARLASLLSELRQRLNARVRWEAAALWPATWGAVNARAAAPEDALSSGASLGDIIEAAVHDSLRATLRDAVGTPCRAAVAPAARDLPGLAWYGQHDAYWVAHHDVWRRAGLVTYRPADGGELDLWAALARSGGWWWPGHGLCVMTDRTAAVRSEPLPGSWHGELRLHCPDGPAIRYPDGHGIHVLHGTPVPAWVLTDPTIERVRSEPNVEVRRCAIERIGWDTYIELAGLSLVGACADPGNPGAELRLYDQPTEGWGAPERVLLVVNGTPEPDGHHRRYGLSVPAEIDNPIAAAGWSYGLPQEHYARLIRRS